jgi:hypothetical protein
VLGAAEVPAAFRNSLFLRNIEAAMAASDHLLRHRIARSKFRRIFGCVPVAQSRDQPPNAYDREYQQQKFAQDAL